MNAMIFVRKYIKRLFSVEILVCLSTCVVSSLYAIQTDDYVQVEAADIDYGDSDISYVDTDAHSGDLKRGERCLAFYNVTNVPVTLVLDLYENKRGLRGAFSSLVGRMKGTRRVAIKIPPREIFSLAGSPQRGTEGEQRQFIENIFLKQPDGSLVPFVADQDKMESARGIEAVNEHFARYLASDSLCHDDSPDFRKKGAVMIIKHEQLVDWLEQSPQSATDYNQFGKFGDYQLGWFKNIPYGF